MAILRVCAKRRLSPNKNQYQPDACAATASMFILTGQVARPGRNHAQPIHAPNRLVQAMVSIFNISQYRTILSKQYATINSIFAMQKNLLILSATLLIFAISALYGFSKHEKIIFIQEAISAKVSRSQPQLKALRIVCCSDGKQVSSGGTCVTGQSYCAANPCPAGASECVEGDEVNGE